MDDEKSLIKTASTNFKSLSRRELSLMTNRKVINDFRTIYSQTESHQKARLENIDVSMISNYQREEILEFIKTLVEKYVALPQNVHNYHLKAKIRY